MAANLAQYCPSALYAGGCTTQGCTLVHKARLCEICGVICGSPSVYKDHIRGRRHLKTSADARKPDAFPFCLVCERDLGSLAVWKAHINGTPHRKMAARKGLPTNIQPPDAAQLAHHAVQCPLCALTVLRRRWPEHIQTMDHKRREAIAAHRGAFEHAEQDKEGIVVSPEGEVDFGVLKPDVSRAGAHKVLVLHLAAGTSSVELERVAVFDKANRISSSFNAQLAGDGRLVNEQDVQLRVSLTQGDFGRYDGHMELHFRRQSPSRRFVIVRSLRAIVGDKGDREHLKAATPHVAKKRVPWKNGQRYYPGRRPPALDAVPWVRKLKTYPIPPELVATIRDSAPDELAQIIRSKHLPPVLNAATHSTHFKILSWVEEWRMEYDLRRYDIADVTFAKEGGLYYLSVPGLAEKRPSVVVGDKIEVQPAQSDPSGRCFEGFVHEVRLTDVGVAFHASFKPTQAAQFNVRFKLNRIPLRRQHEALGVLPAPSDRILFPASAHIRISNASTRVNSLSLYNALIASNAPQLQAIRRILQRPAGLAPFIIFGPPGTGKTITMVEAIRQLLQHNPDTRILACAPSNSAADILAERLMALGPEQLFRYYAVSRTKSAVPEQLLPFTYINTQGYFSVPELSTLAKYRVIVSTCGSASFAHGVGLPQGHFGHIFVDEAGQATEVEVMTAVRTMAVSTTNIVLSGDPKQLGPIIRSSAARDLGLGVSYLERLMERAVYSDQSVRGTAFVKLVKNFRSHKAILDFPNERFYANELEVCGSPSVINSFIGWPHLVSRKFPVVFHSISGQDEREASSPSYFNIDEITVLKDYIQKLKADARYKISDEEIGIIAPYRAQVRKIRMALSKAAPNIKVASVEEFQGQERRVIILSTVRSTRDLLQYDQRYTLGFVANPRRFNVAVTRAKALLIVIGNASVLSTDPLWRRFLNYVSLNNGWRGEPISWNPAAPVQDDVEYASELRQQGVADVAAFMQRMQSYADDPGATADELESGANMEMAFVEPE